MVGPGVERLAGELRTVVECDPFGRATPQQQLRQEAYDALTRQRGIHLNRQTFPCDAIEHIQRAEASPVGERILHEVDRPGFTRLPGLRLDPARGARHALACPSADRQPLQAIEALDAFVIEGIAAAHLALEQEVQTSIAPAWALRRQRAQSFAQLRLVGSSTSLIPDRASLHA